VLIDRSVDVAPHAVDLHVGLVNEPPITRTMPVETGRVREQACEPVHPAVDGDVIDLHMAFSQ
jgi:hypothetical protein